MNTVEVPYFRKQKDRIVCEICPRECKLGEGQVGFCQGREVIDGKLIATNYAQAASVAIDPIEKKPLYHVFPGSSILSLGPNACNMSCDFCQNWQISQDRVPTREITVQDLVKHAGSNGSVGVAYTYSEPLMWYEYLRDSAIELKKKGYIVVVITNGYICEKPLRDLLPLIDAMNIDFKSIEPEFYRKLCGGNLEDVQRTIKIAHDEGCHIELTHLIVTGWNDNTERFRRLVDWVATLDPDIPLHLSRYFPHNRYHEPPTSVSFLQQAYEIALESLNFVYLGNILINGTSDTVCPDCGKLAISRGGYRVTVHQMDNGHCANCGRSLNMLVNPTGKTTDSS
jgi:pyruvate formate lyase activating enzyme